MKITTASIHSTDPLERGRDIGTAHGEAIRATVQRYLDFFALRGVPPERTRRIAESCLAALADWAPGLAQELEATAQAAGVEAWRLAAVNARTEVLSVVGPDTEGECTTAVYLPLERGTAGPPQTIQTWDWHAHLSPEALLLSYRPEDSRVGRVRLFTEFGVLGKIGVNDAGVGLHFNILHHASDRGEGGVPVHAIARRVLDEARDLAEAEGIIRSAPASASTVLTVASAAQGENTAACFEISPERVSVVRPGADGWLLHTNNFLGAEQLPGEATRDRSTTYARLDHMARQRAEMADLPITERAARMCGALGDEAPVCFRPDPAAPLHEQWTTLLTVGLDLVAGGIDYYPGTPAELAEHGALRFE